MSDDERGKIRNPQFKSQIIDFSGLQFDTITPTDIDGMIDFNNRLFVYLEYKFGDAEMPFGQRLALERQAAIDERAGVPAYVLQASHNSTGNIDGANSKVVKYFYKGQWRTPGEELTVRQAIERIRARELNGTSR